MLSSRYPFGYPCEGVSGMVGEGRDAAMTVHIKVPGLIPSLCAERSELDAKDSSLSGKHGLQWCYAARRVEGSSDVAVVLDCTRMTFGWVCDRFAKVLLGRQPGHDKRCR